MGATCVQSVTVWGITNVIASNDSLGEKKAGEMEIKNEKIRFKYVDI